jgi:hypothetical protein
LLDAAKEPAVLLYSPGIDTFLEDLTRNADRVFCFNECPRASMKRISKAFPRAQKSQKTLEAWTWIRWLRRAPARQLEPMIRANPRLLWSFRRPKRFWERSFMLGLGGVDEMIQNRLEDRNWRDENRWPDEDGLGPESFCLGK